MANLEPVQRVCGKGDRIGTDIGVRAGTIEISPNIPTNPTGVLSNRDGGSAGHLEAIPGRVIKIELDRIVTSHPEAIAACLTG